MEVKLKAVRKSFLSFMIIVLLFSGFFHVVRIGKASPATTVYVDPPMSAGNPGEYFTINITVAEVTDLYAWEFYLMFDPGILYTNETMITEGPFLKVAGSTYFDYVEVGVHNETLDYAYAWCELDPVGSTSGSGTLASVEFLVAHGGGESNLTLEPEKWYTALYETDWDLIPCELEHGLFYTSAPRALFTYTIDEPVLFNATDSYDPDGNIVSYEWDFGDTNTTTVYDPIVTHTYEEAGAYNVSLTVTDNAALTDTKQETFNIIKIRVVDAVTGEPTIIGSSGQNFTIDVTVTGVTADRGVSGWDVKLSWDPDILYTDEDWIEEGDFLISLGATTFVKSVEASGMTIGSMLMTPVSASGSGILATATLQVVAGGTGECSLDFSDTKLLDIDVARIPHAAEDGLFYTLDPKARFIYYTETYPPPNPGVQPIFNPIVGELITFDATGSYDADGNIVSWDWDFDDETTDSDEIVTHAYTQAGPYTVNLTVTDNASLTDSESRSLSVVIHDIAITSVEISPTIVLLGEVVTINITVTNEGTETEYFNITCSYDSTAIWYNETTNQEAYSSALEYNPVTHLYGISLMPSENMSRVFTWNTTGVAEGTYTILVNAFLVDTFADFVSGETDTADNTYPSDVVVTLGNPVASFTYSPTVPKIGETVNFNASASYDDGTIVSYSWDFGDGGTGTGETATHAYTADGTYTVNLTVTDDDDLTGTETKSITLAKPPVADFTVIPTTPIAGETVTFVASASQPNGGIIVSYSWDFGDGDTTSTPTSTITHVYTTVGTYTVNLTITDSEGLTDTEIKSITAYARPVASFTYSPTAPKSGETVNFDAAASSDPDGTIVSYSWDFGDGNTGTEVTATYAYTADDIYTVTLTVTDDDGLTDTDHKTVTVSAVPVHDVAVTNVTASPSEVFIGNSVSIDVTVANEGNMEETFNVTVYYDSTSIDVRTDVTLSVGAHITLDFLWNTTGVDEDTYTIKANATQVPDETDTADNLFTDGTVTISIPLPPVASFTYSPASPAVGETVDFDAAASSDPDGTIVSYSWDFGDGDTGTGETPTHAYTADGTYTVNLTVTDDDGLTDWTSKDITPGLEPPVANFTWLPLEPMVGDMVTFTSTSTDPDGTVDSWAWDFNDDGVTDATIEIATWTYTTAGTYTVTLTVTDNDTLTDSTSANITVSPALQPPVASFTYSPASPAVGETVDFDAAASSDPDGTIVSYSWDFGDGDTGTGETPTHVYTTGVAYTVTLIVTDNDGLTDTATQSISITGGKLSSSVSITVSPTAITIGKGTTIIGFITPARVGANVTIESKIGEGDWSNITTATTIQWGAYLYTWTPTAVGTYQIRARWLGDSITYANVSDVKTVTVKEMFGTISLEVTPPSVSFGSSVGIVGKVEPERPGVWVYINVRKNGGDWTLLLVMITDSKGNYSYEWTPTDTGTYELQAMCKYDIDILGSESEIRTITVKAVGVPLDIYIYVAFVATTIILAGVLAVYFFRKRIAR